MEHNSLLSIRKLVKTMEQSPNADYSNWGIHKKKNKIWFGKETGDQTLKVPLLDIVDFANDSFAEHGYDELFIIFGDTDTNGKLQWGITSLGPNPTEE